MYILEYTFHIKIYNAIHYPLVPLKNVQNA